MLTALNGRKCSLCLLQTSWCVFNAAPNWAWPCCLGFVHKIYGTVRCLPPSLDITALVQDFQIKAQAVYIMYLYNCRMYIILHTKRLWNSRLIIFFPNVSTFAWRAIGIPILRQDGERDWSSSFLFTLQSLFLGGTAKCGTACETMRVRGKMVLHDEHTQHSFNGEIKADIQQNPSHLTRTN